VRIFRLPAADATAGEYARQALEYHRQAVRLRPSASYSWASIALLKAILPEPDAEFQAALRNAALLGPWEPEVQIAVAEAGLSRWDQLSPPTRTAVRGTLARAVQWQDAKLFAIARKTGQLPVLCGLPEATRSPLVRACI